jgi:probable DNA metabolism protein
LTDVFTYDGSFAGLLTAIFDIYQYRKQDVAICQRWEAAKLGGNPYEVITDRKKAARVWQGLKQKVGSTVLKEIYYTYLSEAVGKESLLLYFVRYILSGSKGVENNYSDPHVLTVKQIAHNVGKEKHRFEAFVRFNKLSDGLFYSVIEPDCNVLPIIAPHFKRRYADQDWLIYDAKRKYGIHYSKDREEITEVILSNENTGEKALTLLFDQSEIHYQTLWKNYFKSTDIQERKNMKLHLQHVPKRYWKYLTEKK